MLGLGDSKYTTFFLNPTAIDSAMAKAGAERVGSLGKADASGKGDKLQLKVIDDWSRDILVDLKRVVEELDGLDDMKWKDKEEEIEVARGNTCDICRVVYEDWDVKTGAGGIQMMMYLIPLLLAILVALYFKSS